jgi:hypothetical protein
MTEKRTRTRKPASGSEPKAKKAKTTKERDGGKGEGGEECACSGSERHGNVTQCEERRKVWGDVVTS